MTALKVPADQLAAVSAALRQLRIRPGKAHRVESLAGSIVFATNMMSMNELPRAHRTGTAAAVRELRELRALAKRLHRHCAAMHRTALAAVEAGIKAGGVGTHPLLLTDDLEDAIAAAEAGLAVLKATPPQPPPKGRHRNARAIGCVRIAANAYRELTGKEPGRGADPFMLLCDQIFEALRIRAGTERAVRDVLG